MYKFSQRSKDNLKDCSQDLKDICNEVIKHIDFTVIEGHRTLERQNLLYREGKSQIDGLSYKGKHNYLPSKAVDIIPCGKGINAFDGSLESELLFYKLYVQMQLASEKLKIKIKWGGSWESFIDLPHYEI